MISDDVESAAGALALASPCRPRRRLRRRLDLRAAVHLSHRPVRRLGHADRRRHARLPHMLNERDGGIGGVKLVVEECETGYDTKKGLECYDR